MRFEVIGGAGQKGVVFQVDSLEHLAKIIPNNPLHVWECRPDGTALEKTKEFYAIVTKPAAVANVENPQPMPWCEVCQSYHVVPKNLDHAFKLRCRRWIVDLVKQPIIDEIRRKMEEVKPLAAEAAERSKMKSSMDMPLSEMRVDDSALPGRMQYWPGKFDGQLEMLEHLDLFVAKL